MSERRRAREASERMDQDDGLDDRTIAVDRSDPSTMDETELVQRQPRPEIDEATAAVIRPGAHPLVDDDTVVAERGGWLPEGTVRVGGPSPSQAFSGPLGAGIGAAPTPVDRFAPPVAGRRAVLGGGAGSTSRYTTRRVVAPAPRAEAVPQAADATRDRDAVLPSVRRRARRGAAVSLVSAGVATIVTIAGLVVVIPLLLAG
ncbi:hypothetical protein [Arenivirga flava]|uniref:Uncharacterized protein n=1 Tax=Arenivirga flava TaxID=1930060 RepID=A0AA37XBE1_9MICO|nr:hypothetical protein [Arenivirga flava]GMA28531.1 hypothetical protein GCM10025874_17840 [Arenivirga flava]